MINFTCIDISSWNGDIDFKKVKNYGITSVIMKIGEGTFKDNRFESYYKSAKAAGLKVGGYFFCACNTVEGASQEAARCLKYVKGKSFDLPIYYDMEYDWQQTFGKTTLTKFAVAFMEAIIDGGLNAGVYANYNWAVNLLDLNKIKKLGSIWHAAPGASSPSIDCDIWQFSFEGNIPGIHGDVDCNKIIKDPSTGVRVSNVDLLADDSDYTSDMWNAPSITVDVESLNPYIITIDRNTHTISSKEWNKMKDYGVCGVLVEAGKLFNKSHLKVDYRSPKLKSQIKGIKDAGLPWGLYCEMLAKSVSDANNEIEELRPCVRLYPPKLGLWLKCTFTNNKSVNDNILQRYYEELVRLGLINKIGLICSKGQLGSISWETRWSDHYCLWLVNHISDVSELNELLTPSFFLSGKGENADRG